MSSRWDPFVYALRPGVVHVTQLKRRAHEVIRSIPDRDVVVVRYGHAVAVVLAFDRYDALITRMDELEDRLACYERAPAN